MYFSYKSVVSKSSEVLPIIALACSSLFPPELYSLIFFPILLFLFVENKCFDDFNFRVIAFLLILVGLPGFVFIADNEVYDSLKDVWYFLKILECLFLGYFSGRIINDYPRFSVRFIYLCIVLVAYYIFRFFYYGSSEGMDAAYESGGFPLVCVVAPIFFISKNSDFSVKFPAYIRFILGVVFVGALFLSFSRTVIGSLMILILTSFGFLDNWKRAVLSVFASLFFIVSLIGILPKYDASDISFVGKLGNSFEEISFVDSFDQATILKNWRGFESFNAQYAFDHADLSQKIFGGGFGSTVDLGMYIYLSEEMVYRYMPILHNGYYHILTKFGVLGLFFYVAFLLMIAFPFYLSYLYKDRKSIFSYRAIAGIGFVFFYTSLVITGVFNKNVIDPFLVLLGIFFGYAYNYHKNLVDS